MNNFYVLIFKEREFVIVQFVQNQPSVVYENGETRRDVLNFIIDQKEFWKSFKEVNMIESPVDVAFASVSDESILNSLDMNDLTCSVSDEDIKSAVKLIYPDYEKYSTRKPSKKIAHVIDSKAKTLETNADSAVNKIDETSIKKEKTGLTHEYFIEKHKIYESNRISQKNN